MSPAINTLGTKLTTRKEPDRILSHRACHTSRRPASRGGSTGRGGFTGRPASRGGSTGRGGFTGRPASRGGSTGRPASRGGSTGWGVDANGAASDTEAITKENLIGCVSVCKYRHCVRRGPPRVFVPKSNI